MVDQPTQNPRGCLERIVSLADARASRAHRLMARVIVLGALGLIATTLAGGCSPMDFRAATIQSIASWHRRAPNLWDRRSDFSLDIV